MKAEMIPPHPRQLLHNTVLVVLLALGFTLRVWNINFDQGLSTHPDERSTTCFIAPSIGWPRTLEEFTNTERSPLNPMWNRVEQRPTNYTYGHFPLYLGIVAGNIMHTMAPIAERVGAPTALVETMARGNQPCGGVAIPGRLVIAALDTWTIFLLYLLGRRVFGSGAGLLAAGFYAFTAQAIQLSHFFAMDPASTTFTVLAVLGGVMMVQTRTLRPAFTIGIAAGMAIASKFSALPVLAVPVTAVTLWLVMAGQAPMGTGARSQVRALAALVVAFVVAALTFFLTSPYAILDWDRFIQATLIDQGQMVRGVADMPFTRQYRNTAPYIYFIQQQVQWGLGWPLGILSLVGTLVAAGALCGTLVRLANALARNKLQDLTFGRVELANVIVWSWVAPYFGITGAFLAKFNRYMSPVLPFVVLFAAGLLWLGWQWGGSRVSETDSSPKPRRVLRWGMGGIGAVVLSSAVIWSLAFVSGIHGREHTWISASRWIYDNVPRGSVILWELWDDRLPIPVPNEPGLEIGAMGLNTIDWSPYEEDTAEKYQILKEKLKQADYVVYASKRIYDSVDELPERYPMTNLYYDAMWDGRLGFELAAEFTSPPQLLGITFEDRHADESWSLYDHPQVTVFRKVRQLSDAEFDALFDRAWERAIPYYRGQDSPISPLLALLGMSSQPGSERSGIMGMVVGLFSRETSPSTAIGPEPRNDLMFDEPIANLPVVDDYRWNSWASERPMMSVLVWWFVITAMGIAAWPLVFGLFGGWLDRGYLFGRTFGWLLGGWLLWLLASADLLHNTVMNSWLTFGVVLIAGVGAAWRQRTSIAAFVRERWALILVEEALFAVAFAYFVFLRMVNPDLWQPWFGGEKFMEFAFLNGILRSPTFPPVDPHFAGGYINYYYFGIYMVGYLIKLTGIYAEVAFNLTIPLLFALTVVNAFAIAHTAWAIWRNDRPWTRGVATALLGPFLVAMLGNLDGYGQIVRQLSERSPIQMQSALPGLTWLVEGVGGLVQVALGQATLPPYDFWGPSRVIPETINEFPYWSFLFADLHPHLIGIPLSIFFVGVAFSLFMHYETLWQGSRWRGAAYLALGAFLLGALISVNLWELPTYFGLLVLTLLVAEYRWFGRIRFGRVALVAVGFLVMAIVLYLPFFLSYVNVGASGIGLVRNGDEPTLWLLLWGGLGFIIVSWLVLAAGTGGRPAMLEPNRLRPGRISEQAHADSIKDMFSHSLDAPTEEESRQVPQERRVDGSEVEFNEMYHVGDVRRVEHRATRLGNELPVPTGIDSGGVAFEEQSLQPEDRVSGYRAERSGVARLVGICLRNFERLPRVWYLHGMFVQSPTLVYLLGVAAIPAIFLVAILSAVLGRVVLGLCLALLAFSLPLLWRRQQEADSADHLATMLAVTGLALLAGTQVFFLKDFLQGDAWYRMNTLFKFFNQVWVLWALAGAIVLPRVWSTVWRRFDLGDKSAADVTSGERADLGAADAPATTNLAAPRTWRGWGLLWRVACVLILAACSTYLLFGTPSRLSQRFVGWVPPFGTLNGLAFMQQGRYAWPNESNTIELGYDYLAIQWLLDNIRGNLVIAESAEVDYYRAGGTRVASMTGLSGLRGAHVSEQRYGQQVGTRDGLHREFWSTASVDRTLALIDHLQIALIYVGQLERYHHPEGAQKLANMASEGRLEVLYENQGVVIYAVPGRLVRQSDGGYVPVPAPIPLPLPSLGIEPAQQEPSPNPS